MMSAGVFMANTTSLACVRCGTVYDHRTDGLGTVLASTWRLFVCGAIGVSVATTFRVNGMVVAAGCIAVAKAWGRLAARTLRRCPACESKEAVPASSPVGRSIVARSAVVPAAAGGGAASGSAPPAAAPEPMPTAASEDVALSAAVDAVRWMALRRLAASVAIGVGTLVAAVQVAQVGYVGAAILGGSILGVVGHGIWAKHTGAATVVPTRTLVAILALTTWMALDLARRGEPNPPGQHSTEPARADAAGSSPRKPGGDGDRVP